MRLNACLSLLAASLPAVLSAPSSATTGASLDSRAPVGTTKNVIIQMFEWTWDSIAAECTNFIGPAGYGFVQGMEFVTEISSALQAQALAVSPPQEHITGAQWWTDYQPVSHILVSKRGNRAQFAK